MQRKDSKRREGSSNEPSRVLLVCIYDTVVLNITNEMLYETFVGHGTLDKLLVFEKGQVTKAFVQFADVQEAERAKQELDGSKLLGTYCKMHMFYSNLRDIDLSNRMFSRGKDYSSCSSDIMIPQVMLEASELNQSNVVRTKRKASDDFDLESTRDHFSLQAFGRFSRTDQAEHLQCIENFRMEDPESDDHCLLQVEQRIREDIEKIMVDDDEEIDRREESTSQLSTPTKPEFTSEQQQQLQPQPQPQLPQELPVVQQPPPMVDLDAPCKSILAFAYQHKLRPMEIYNLFSNFGDINKIIVRKHTVVVEFLDAKFAEIAKDSLNGTVFYGNVLRLSFGPQSLLKERSREYAESITLDEGFHRFANSKLSINPPSVVLHVSNIKRECCTSDYLRELFSEAGNVERVSVLGKDRSMALVRMASLEESFNAVGMLHGRSFSGRKLQLSFTKSRL